MKVTGENKMNVTKIYNDNKPKAVPKKEVAEKKYDKIEISREGMEIAKYVSMAKNAPDIRIQKVNEIKSKLQNGTYKISSEAIAEKILEAIKEEK